MPAMIEQLGPLAYKKLAQLLRAIAVAQSRGDHKRVAQVRRLGASLGAGLPGPGSRRGWAAVAAGLGFPGRSLCAARCPRTAARLPPPAQGARLLQHWQSSPQFYEHTMRLVSELGAGAHRSSLMVLRRHWAWWLCCLGLPAAGAAGGCLGLHAAGAAGGTRRPCRLASSAPCQRPSPARRCRGAQLNSGPAD
jgi:hypothetical protein